MHFAEEKGRRATTAARRKCNLSLRRGSTLESSKAEGDEDGRPFDVDGRVDRPANQRDGVSR